MLFSCLSVVPIRTTDRQLKSTNVPIVVCVCIYIYIYIYIYIHTHTHIYIYNIHPDDGLQICLKHAKNDWRNNTSINSASSCFPLHELKQSPLNNIYDGLLARYLYHFGKKLNKYIYIYIYIPIHAHTHTHTHIRTYVHTYILTYWLKEHST